MRFLLMGAAVFYYLSLCNIAISAQSSGQSSPSSQNSSPHAPAPESATPQNSPSAEGPQSRRYPQAPAATPSQPGQQNAQPAVPANSQEQPQQSQPSNDQQRPNNPATSPTSPTAAPLYNRGNSAFVLPNLPQPKQILRLTLKQAVQLALRQNPRVALARVAAEDQEEQRKLDLAALLPQVNWSSSYEIVRLNEQSILGGPHPRTIGPFQSITDGVAGSQKVLDLPSIYTYLGSRHLAKAQHLNERYTRDEVVVSVVNDYISVLRAFADATAAEERVLLAGRLFQQAQNQVDSGVTSTIDALRARVELEAEKQRLLTAIATRQTSIYTLTQVLDLPPGIEAEPSDKLDFFDMPNEDPVILLNKAIASRPDLQAYEEQRLAAADQVKGSKLQRLPAITFSSTWGEQGRVHNELIPAYSYSARIVFPLFSSGRVKAQIERAKLAEERIVLTAEDTRSQVRQQAKSALAQIAIAKGQIDSATLALTLAEQEVEQAQRRYAAGVTTNIEVVTAQNELAQANDNQISALYQYNQARASLARALGNAEDVYGK